MIRIYWTVTNNIDCTTKPKKIIQRWEGGWWFSEEDTLNTRSVFRVLDRLDCLSGLQDCFIEILSPLPSEFVESPCWKEAIPTQWSVLFENSEGVSLLVAESVPLAGAVGQQQQQQQQHLQQLLLSFPASLELSSLPSEVQLHFGMLHQSVYAMLPQVRTLIASKTYLPSFHDAHVQTLATKSEKSPACNASPPQVVKILQNQQNSPKKGGSKPSLQPPIPLHAGSGPKGIQTGSLCQPMILPEKQEPRKTNRQKKKAYHKPRVQTKTVPCLIQLTEA